MDEIIPSDIEAAKITVHGFIDSMNHWEISMDRLTQLERGKSAASLYFEHALDMTEDQLKALYYQIIQIYCTHRKRSYSGHPSSWGKPTKFAGMRGCEFLEAHQPNGNRIELTAKSMHPWESYYRFILFKKSGRWLIDSLKRSNDIKKGEWYVDYF